MPFSDLGPWHVARPRVQLVLTLSADRFCITVDVTGDVAERRW
jgi:hypothetical protein